MMIFSLAGFLLIFALVANYFIIVVSIYCAFIFVLIFGFTRLKDTRKPIQVNYNFISVVVPFRNEAENLPNLLNDLSTIEYPSDKWEVILVDDHSTDNYKPTRSEEHTSELQS